MNGGIDPEVFEVDFMRKQDAATKPLDGYTLDKDGRLKPQKKRQSVSQRIRDRKKPKTKITRAIKGAQKP